MVAFFQIIILKKLYQPSLLRASALALPHAYYDAAYYEQRAYYAHERYGLMQEHWQLPNMELH